MLQANGDVGRFVTAGRVGNLAAIGREGERIFLPRLELDVFYRQIITRANHRNVRRLVFFERSAI